MKSKTVLFYFFVLLIVEISAELLFYFTNNASLIYITKPILMPTLIVWAFFFTQENKIPLNKALPLALVFSMFGDIALMFLSINPDVFIVGLACFLIAHLVYIVIFFKISSSGKSVLLAKPYLALPFLLYGIVLIGYLYQQNQADFIKMQIPVIVYATVILSMFLAAISCYGKISSFSYKFLIIGASLFVLSDTTIALSKFSPLFENRQHIARIIIMGLYGPAQFLIVKGIISSTIIDKHNNEY